MGAYMEPCRKEIRLYYECTYLQGDESCKSITRGFDVELVSLGTSRWKTIAAIAKEVVQYVDDNEKWQHTKSYLLNSYCATSNQ